MSGELLGPGDRVAELKLAVGDPAGGFASVAAEQVEVEADTLALLAER